MNHETTARINHRSGYNCAQAVTVAFATELGSTPIAVLKSAPKPRSAGGKCGAYLAGLQVLNELKPGYLHTLLITLLGSVSDLLDFQRFSDS